MENVQISENTIFTKSPSTRFQFFKFVFSVILLLSIITNIFLIIATVQTPEWQTFLVITILSLICILCLLALREVNEKNYFAFVFSLLISINITLNLISSIFEGASIFAAILNFLISLAISTSILYKYADTGITIGMVTSTTATMLGYISPFPQLLMPTLNVLLPIGFGIILMVFITFVQTGVMITNIRIKLVLISLSFTIIPLLIVSFFTSNSFENSIETQRNNTLQLAANQVSDRLDSFLIENIEGVEQEAGFPVFSEYLLTNPKYRSRSSIELELKQTINNLAIKDYPYLLNYGILNLQGINIYDTNPKNIGQSEASTDYFVQALRTGEGYVSEVRFNTSELPYLYFSAPIKDNDNQLLGVLRIEYDAIVLQKILEENTNLLGKNSNAILITDYNFRIADTVSPKNIYQMIIPIEDSEMNSIRAYNWVPNLEGSKFTQNLPNFANAITQYGSSKFFTGNVRNENLDITDTGYIKKLSNKDWYIVYTQELTALRLITEHQINGFVMLASIITVIVGMISTFFSRSFSSPIIKLSEAALKISQGNLETKTDVKTNDEIGFLANTFTKMTDQLRSSIQTLENRVMERTQELEEQNLALSIRSSQFRTVADVARNIVTSQELDKFLNNITEIISDRFHFYHVGIFLLDDKKEFAVLRAANSEGGKRMLARNHKLQIGKVGIVGYATGFGQSRIVTDVGADAVYFNNPDLPLTRSEMALPLIADNEIIGAIDVQSTESNAFTEDDVELFRTLADQVAIAIFSNHLYNETRAALEESERIYRQYLQQEWQKTTNTKSDQGVIYSENGFKFVQNSQMEEINNVLSTGKPLIINEDKENPEDIHLIVPIQLRGQPIGAIKIRDKKSNKNYWSEEELDSVSVIAENVGLALEGARLFEQTVRRANRERQVVEITSKIRATNDPQQMVKIAIQELKQALGTSKAQIIIKDQTIQPENEEKSNSGNGNHKIDDLQGFVTE